MIVPVVWVVFTKTVGGRMIVSKGLPVYRFIFVLVLGYLIQAMSVPAFAQGDPFSGKTSEFIPLSDEVAEQLLVLCKKDRKDAHQEVPYSVGTVHAGLQASVAKRTQVPESPDDIYWEAPIPATDNFEFWKVTAIAISGSRIYVGGEFSRAGNLSVNNIAWYDTATKQWGALGEGVDSPVRHVVAGNGKVYVEGAFAERTGQLAQWDEVTEEWSDLEGGLHSDQYVAVNDMDMDAEGNLYVAGKFEQAGSVAVSNIAMWDGESWHDLHGGVDGEAIIDIDAAGSRLYVGGVIYSAGNVAVSGIALWNGNSWSAVGSLSFQSQTRIAKILATPSSVMVLGYVLGTTPNDEFVTGILWSGTQWSALSDFISPFGEQPRLISNAALLSNGDFLVVGSFSRIGNVQASDFAVLKNSVWSELPLPDYCERTRFGNVHLVLESFGSEFVIGGTFSRVGEQVLAGVARLKGVAFNGLGAGVRGSKVEGSKANDAITAFATGLEGELYFGGKFNGVAGVVASNIVKWDQAGWHPVGKGVNIITDLALTTVVTDLQVAQDGTLYAVGSFDKSGDIANPGIVRWNGEQWLPVFDFPWSVIHVLRFGPDGTLYAAGYDNNNDAIVARLDGDAWYELKGKFYQKEDLYLISGKFHDLAFNGTTVYIAGEFNFIQGSDGDTTQAWGVAQWTGNRWEPLGEGIRSVNDDFPNIDFYSVARSLILSGNSLLVGGEFNRAGQREVSSLAAWNIQTEQWSNLGGGIADIEEPSGKTVNDLAMIGNELYVVGAFDHVGDVPAQNIAMWDGTKWNPLGSGIEIQRSGASTNASLVADRNGNLFVVSDYLSMAGGKDVRYVAQWTKPTLSVPVRSTPLANHQVRVVASPVQGRAQFHVALAQPASVHIRIYSIVGEYVGAVMDGFYQPGEYQLQWDTATLPSGTYVYTVEAGVQQSSGLVVVVHR